MSKLKFQEDLLSKTRDRAADDDDDDEDVEECDDSITNSRKFTVENADEYEDLTNIRVDQSLLDRPLCKGATVSNIRQYSRALTFLQYIKEQRELKSAANLMEFVKQDCELSIDEIRKPSQKLMMLHSLYDKMSGKNGQDQRHAFDVVAAHLLEQPCCKTRENPTGQLRMFISGEGGTGKSTLINLIRLYSRIHFGHDGTKYGPVLVVAPTGVAANNIDGSTIDHACFTWQYNKHESDVHFLAKIQNVLGCIKVLIIDEISMCGANLLGKLDKIFRKATLKFDQFMGGVHFVLAGDFYQLPPVFKDVLYRQSLKKVDEIYQAGIDVYRSCTCFKELIFNFRQLNENLFLETLQGVRVGQTTDVDVELFRTRTRESVKSNEIESLPPETLFVASRHVTCDIGNSKHIDELEKNGCDVIDCWAIHTRPCKMSSKNKSQSSNEDAENIDIDAGENERFKFVSNLHMNNASAIDSDEALEILRHNVDSDQGNILVPHLRLCLQARVMLLVNACTEEGLVNGATGTVVGFLYADSKSCSTLTFLLEVKLFQIAAKE